MKYVVPITAILAIAALEAYWMSLGHNGVYLAAALVAIAGIGGYELRKFRGT